MVIAVGDMAITAGGKIMPRGDRRGPNGMGPMTGRGAGFCNGFNAPGNMNFGSAGKFGPGRRAGSRGGFGPGHGAGRGLAPGFYGAAYGGRFDRAGGADLHETEKGYIENELSLLKDQLSALEARLSEMKEDE